MNKFKSFRKTKTITQVIHAPASELFPLLCPVREYEWLEIWSCDMIYSESGIAENNCIFKTDFPDKGGEETWVISRYEKNKIIEFVRLNPDFMVTKLDIKLKQISDKKTEAVWTKIYTGLSHEGNTFVQSISEDQYKEEIAGLEKMLNHYLNTGKMLKI